MKGTLTGSLSASITSLSSTPKQEISWKELSVLLKSSEKENSRSKSQPRVYATRSRVRKAVDRKQPSATKTAFASPSRCGHGAFASLSGCSKPKSSSLATFQSPSARVARLRQSQVARKMLESISPHVFMRKKNLSCKRSSTTMSPVVTKSRSLHRTPPRVPKSGRKRRVSDCLNLNPRPLLGHSSPMAKTPRSLAKLRNSLNGTPLKIKFPASSKMSEYTPECQNLNPRPLLGHSSPLAKTPRSPAKLRNSVNETPQKIKFLASSEMSKHASERSNLNLRPIPRHFSPLAKTPRSLAKLRNSLNRTPQKVKFLAGSEMNQYT